MSFDVAAKPACGDTRMASFFASGDQYGQLERLAEADAADFARGRLGNDEVAMLESDRPSGEFPRRGVMLL